MENFGQQGPIEQAPIVNRFGSDGATFKGAGNSHITHENGQFHETTEIPGMQQGQRVNIKTDIPPNGF